MNSKITSLVVLTAFTFSISSIGRAAGYGDNAPNVPSSQKSDNQEPAPVTTTGLSVTGTIESVNVPSNEIVVTEESGARDRRTISGSTVLMSGDSTISISDLRPGDSVTLVEDPQGQVSEVRVNYPTR